MELAAFVFMPEHVHLLVVPLSSNPEIDRYLARIKQPFSKSIKELLLHTKSPLVDRLTVQERPGKICFRFWQEGPGYDRNLQREASVLAAIDYIHNNPVRRNLCEVAANWRWSSAAFYASEPLRQDPDLPKITRLPREFFK